MAALRIAVKTSCRPMIFTMSVESVQIWTPNAVIRGHVRAVSCLLIPLLTNADDARLPLLVPLAVVRVTHQTLDARGNGREALRCRAPRARRRRDAGNGKCHAHRRKHGALAL